MIHWNYWIRTVEAPVHDPLELLDNPPASHDSMVFVHVVLTSVYLSLAFILLFLNE